MKDNNKKRIKVFTLVTLGLVVLFLFAGGYYIKKNLENIVNYAINKGLDYNLKIENIEINKFGTLTGRNIILNDKKGQRVLEIPEVVIKYNFRDIIDGRYISELWAKKPTIYLTISKVTQTNIMSALNLDKKKKSSAPSPLKYIKVSDGILYYNDISYKKPIKMKLKGVEGSIDLKKLLKLNFSGSGFDDETEKLSFGIKEVKKGKNDYSVSLKNVVIKDELLQYAYDDNETITYKGGRGDLDLKFGVSGLSGTAFIKKGIIKYKYLVDDLKNVDSSIELTKEKINIYATSSLDKYKVNFELNKNKNYLGIFFDSEDVNLNYVFKNLPKKDFYKDIKGNVELLKGKLVFDNIKTSKPNLELYADSKEINWFEHKFSKAKIDFDFDFNKFKFIINDLDTEYTNSKSINYPIKLKAKLKGIYEEDKLKFDYNLINIKSFFLNKKFNGNFVYDFKKEQIDLKNKDMVYPFDFSYNFKTTNMAIKGNFIEPISFGNEVIKNNSLEGRLDLSYNFEKKSLSKAEGNVIVHNDIYFKDLNLSFENIADKIIINEAYGTRGDSSFKGRGTVNIKTLDYDAEVFESNIHSKDFPFLKNVPEFVANTTFTISGKSKDFLINYNTDIESLNYGVLLKNTHFYGVVESKNNNINGTAEGYVEQLNYNELSFKDLYLNLSFDKNKVYIEEIKNANLFLSGTYGISSNDLDIDYKLNDYDLQRAKSDKYNIKGHIGSVVGKITGNPNNPSLFMDLTDSVLNYNNTENAKIHGKLSLKNKVIYLEDFYFKENKFLGTINLEKEYLNLKANLLESNLNNYYKDTNVKYRVMGVVNIWGNYDDVRAVAQVNLDSIYYRGKKIPDLFLKLSYVDGDLAKISETGKLNLTELKILGDSGFNIIEAEGYLDIFSKKFDVKLGNENLAIKDIEYLVNDYKLSGKLNLNFEASGTIKGKMDYELSLKSTGLKYNNITIDKIYAKMSGNEKKLNVEYLEMNYGNNMLKSEGEFNIEKNTYDFSVKANDFDLGIFNIILGEKVKDISGKANIDIALKNDSNNGTLSLVNASVSSSDRSLIFKNINSEIDINMEGIKIKSFTGSLNNGTIAVDGYLKIPKFSEELLANPMSVFNDYSVNVKLDDVDYNYDKTVLINLDTDINYSNNFLSGDILINNGNVFKLPSLGKKDEVKEPMKIGFDAKLDINIGEGIYFTADNIPLIEDIELKIEGGGTLEIKDSKINFMGRLLSEDGALTFNSSIFKVESGIIIFDGINEYFPNINPSLAIKAQTEISSEEVYITISGYYDALTLDLQSSSGLSTQDITALLLFKSNVANSSVNSVVKDIIDKQFSEEIFSPLSKELEKLLNISKVKISSKLLKLDDETLSLTPNLLLGTTFEFRDSLYKNKIFWNGLVEFSEEKSGDISNYDLWLDYQLNNNAALSLGVQRLEEDGYSDKNNIHLGIDFKYQRDSIFKRK